MIQCPGRCPQGGCGQGGGREPAAAPTVGRGLRSGLHSQFTPAFPTSSSHPVPCPGPSLSPSEGSLPTATCGTRMQPAAGFQAPLPPSPAGSQPKLPSSHPPWAGGAWAHVGGQCWPSGGRPALVKHWPWLVGYVGPHVGPLGWLAPHRPLPGPLCHSQPRAPHGAQKSCVRVPSSWTSGTSAGGGEAGCAGAEGERRG